MRGDEWNRLVGEPSAMDVEAALADVRIRAVPIARRNARNRRAASLLGFVAVALAGGAAGNLAFRADRVSFSGESRQVSGAQLLVEPAGYLPAPGPIQRWHISAWDEMEGYRWNEGRDWVEGPVGATLRLELQNVSLHAAFAGTLNVEVRGDSTRLYLEGHLTRDLGGMADGYYADARKYFARSLVLHRGQSAVFLPFGGSEIRTTIRLDGPFAPAGVERASARRQSLYVNLLDVSEGGLRNADRATRGVARTVGGPGRREERR